MGGIRVMKFHFEAAPETPNLDLPVAFAKRERHLASLSITQPERSLAVKSLLVITFAM
jgi:hypothetical protein